MTRKVLDLDPRSYRRHPIHGEGRIWAETNCYVDVWIELAHSLGFEPIAALPFTLTIDFEGDQWTFFKFPLADLYELYGLEVQELALWRPLVEHIEEQLGRGRPVLVELDSFHLPDTSGSAYRQAHVKSTVAAVAIDRDARRLGYFHNQGYFELAGEDFAAALRIDEPLGGAMLPPYTEFVKVRDRQRDEETLPARSIEILRRHLAMVPASNPFDAFRDRFRSDLDDLLGASLDTFHQYSFATLRQYGACFELAATYLQWLAGHGCDGLDEPVQAFLSISESAKTFQFQLARAMARRKPLDLAPLDSMAESWERGTSAVASRFR